MIQTNVGESLAFWCDRTLPSLGEAIERDESCDVCIVGAGIAGLTTAYLLQREFRAQGKKVYVIEAFDIGSGQTGRTTAHFSNALDDRYIDIEKYHGARGARLAADSHTSAMELVESIAKVEKIDCDLKRVDGYLFRAKTSDLSTSSSSTDSQDILMRELIAAQKAGLADVYLTREVAPHPFLRDQTEALCFPRQLQLHPMKYLEGLARCFLRDGGRIFTHSPVSKISGGKDANVTTRGGFDIKASSIVVATNTPINDIFALHTKQAPYRSYVIGIKIPKDSVPDALYWDTLEDYHYVRKATPELLIVGGEDHKTGQDDDPAPRYQRLENWVRKILPSAGEVVYRWSGQVMEPVDGMAFLGHNPLDRNNVYIITGDSGNGMTHGTIGGILITDQIMGRENEWEKLYSPSRVSVRAVGEFIKENANVAAQYLDWLTPKDLSDVSSIASSLAKGEGALIREGVRVLAVYRGENGHIEKMSATCPHLGGIVHWNPAEKSWDCPCHGSRFDCHGKVIEGPAHTDLTRVDGKSTAPPEQAL